MDFEQYRILNELDLFTSEFNNLSELDLSDVTNKFSELPDKILKSLQKINVTKAIEEYQKRQRSIKSELIKYIPDINSKIKNLENTSKKIANIIKKDYTNKKNITASANKIKNLIENKVKKSIKEMTDSEKLSTTIIFILIIYIINTICFSIVIYLTHNKLLAVAITTIFSAPLIEEKMKNVALKTGINFGFQFTFAFAMFEFFYYVMSYMAFNTIGVGIIPFMVARAITVIFHMSTASVQSAYVKNNQSEMGYFVGVLMHVIWNAISFAPLLL